MLFYRLGFPLKIAKNGVSSSDVDGIVYVSSAISTASSSILSSVFKNFEEIDEAFNSNISVIPVNLPAGKISVSFNDLCFIKT